MTASWRSSSSSLLATTTTTRRVVGFLSWALCLSRCCRSCRCLVAAYPGMAKNANSHNNNPRVLSVKELVNLLSDLRQGDDRLVRPSPTEETMRQQTLLCPANIPSFLLTLCSATTTNTGSPAATAADGTESSSGTISSKMTVSLQTRGFAAEALTMCIMDQPLFRNQAFANSTTLFYPAEHLHATTTTTPDDDKSDSTTEDFDSNQQEILTEIRRQQLTAHSLAEGLVVLLRDGLEHYHAARLSSSPEGGQAGAGGDGAMATAIHAMAQAAEAIWISSYHHPGHTQQYLRHNAVAILGEIIVTTTTTGNDNNSVDTTTATTAADVAYPFPPARAVMWACAALQNLAANYCDSEWGDCSWKWKRQQPSSAPPSDPSSTTAILTLEDGALTLDEPALAERVRRQIADRPHLLPALADWVCRGPVDQPRNETYGWPGEALLWNDPGAKTNVASPQLQSPTLVPWAAAGAVKNLLLSPTIRRAIVATGNNLALHSCLCDMTRSPDWLEQGKAEDAVYFWAPPPPENGDGGDDEDGFAAAPPRHPTCPDIYEFCQDDGEWYNAETGETCQEYTEQRWCVEFGGDVDGDGKTANEACCLCGGGYDITNGEYYDGDGDYDDYNGEGDNFDDEDDYEEGDYEEGDYEEGDYEEGGDEEGDYEEGDYEDGDFEEGDFEEGGDEEEEGGDDDWEEVEANNVEHDEL